jgi:hypothetical protein
MTKQTNAREMAHAIDYIPGNKTIEGDATPQKKKSKEITNDRTKENMQDFALAATGAKLIRQVFGFFLTDSKNSSFNLRLNQEMSRVVKADTVNARGSRNIADGNIGLLQGLEVNTDMPLTSALKAPFEAFIDRARGVAKVDFPSLITTASLNKPKGASHFLLTVAGARIDFVTGDHLYVQNAGKHLLISDEGVTAPSLEVQLPPANTATLILALGISFYDKVNRHFYLIGNGRYNAVAFVAVSGS